jgi:nucleoside-diphosphate-sugar epimerase
VTGATGFVGEGLSRSLEHAGWQVVPWTRVPSPGTAGVAFDLGQDVAVDDLRGVDALVHCAYDFAPRSWPEIVRVNVAGSERLFAAARRAGVGRIVFISSLSAFEGCRSRYGRAKLVTERLARDAGAAILRPGLLYGEHAGGLFGQLVAQVRTSRVVPVPVGATDVQYLLHERDLGKVVGGILDGGFAPPTEPAAVAAIDGRRLRDIVRDIAKALGKRPTIVPVPWQAMWLGLKGLELTGSPVGFRSDSLIGLVYQDLHPSFAWLESVGFRPRPFVLDREIVDREIVESRG